MVVVGGRDCYLISGCNYAATCPKFIKETNTQTQTFFTSGSRDLDFRHAY
jgi:hypothetical protein